MIRDRSIGEYFLDGIAQSVPFMMALLAATIVILIFTASMTQTTTVDVDGPLFVDIDTDKRWIVIEVVVYSGNVTLQLVRNGQYCTLHNISGAFRRDMMVRYVYGNTTSHILLNGNGWIRFTIYGYSERPGIIEIG